MIYKMTWDEYQKTLTTFLDYKNKKFPASRLEFRSQITGEWSSVSLDDGNYSHDFCPDYAYRFRDEEIVRAGDTVVYHGNEYLLIHDGNDTFVLLNPVEFYVAYETSKHGRHNQTFGISELGLSNIHKKEIK